MTDFPQPQIPPLFITGYSVPYTCAADMRMMAVGSPTGITWVSNLALYIPLSVPFPYPVRRMFWCNGSTIASGHCDVGLYTQGGTKLVSAGSVAQSGASVLQFVTLSPDIILSPGSYYLAFSCDSSTNHVNGESAWTAAMLRESGVLQQATAFPLPATMTPAAVSNAVFPLCGITYTASGF